MKKSFYFLKSVFVFGTALCLLNLYSCQKDDELTTNPTSSANSDESMDGSKKANDEIYPAHAHMHGRSYSQWVAEWWKWELQFDCAHSPLQDIDGSLQNQNQNQNAGHHVFFLAGKRGHTLNVTVPHDAELLLPLITFESDNPCIDNGNPNPGETIEHFLTRITQGNVDAMDQLSLTIDGKSADIDDYKFVSPLFTTAANADLANCFDGCITGTSQEFVAGGYFVMLKHLKPGNHVIHRVGGASSLFPFLFDITYNVTVLH